jgi:hypothetical protein
MGQELGQASKAAYGSGNSAVAADVSALGQDATSLEDTALGQDGSGYNSALALTNAHIQGLNSDCGPG